MTQYTTKFGIVTLTHVREDPVSKGSSIPSVVVKTFLGLKTKTETLAFRFRDRDLGLQVSKPRPSWTFSTKHERIFINNTVLTLQRYISAVCTLFTNKLEIYSRSRDQDRDLDKMNSSALESRDHGLEITTLSIPHPKGAGLQCRQFWALTYIRPRIVGL